MGNDQSEEITEGDINVNAEDKKLDTEFQKWSTDISPVKDMFECVIAGLRLISTQTREEHLGEVSYVDTITRHYDKDTAIGNKAYASYLFSQVSPLIMQNTSTSTLSKQQIYHLWKGTSRSIRKASMRDYLGDNKYEIKIERLQEVTAFILKLTPFTNNAEGGFKLKQFAQTYLTNIIQRGNLSPERNSGAFDRIQKAFSGGGK